MNKFKVGDVVKVVSGGRGFYESQVGKEFIISEVGTTEYFGGGFGGSYKVNDTFGGWVGGVSFELVSQKQFTKADLRDGMRVVYRICNGDGTPSVRVVVGTSIRFSDNSMSLDFNRFNDDLSVVNSMRDKNPCTIMEVYAAPDKCEDFFNLDVKGPLLWKREDESKEQKELREIEEQLKELGERAAKLREKI